MNYRLAIKSLLTRFSIISIFVFVMVAEVFGQSLLVSDAFTSATSANGNFGTNPVLTISETNTAYVKFEIARTLPAGTKADDVARATVRFYLSKVATEGKLDVFPILANWDEKTITANNAPQVGPLALTTQQIGKGEQGNYFLIDITGLVKQWLGDGAGQNAIPNFGFALAPHPVDAVTPQLVDINFDSKENSQTSHDALLSVQLKSAPAGLQAVATDATLSGDGTVANPLGVAPGAITTTYLGNGAVTAGKIADGAVFTSKLADGSVTSAKIAVPLMLTSANPAFTLYVANTGTGAALTVAGAINSTTQYNIGGSRILSSSLNGNLYLGVNAGATNAGTSNVFLGQNTGFMNTGFQNTFAGAFSGRNNTTGTNNSFFGSSSGHQNSTGVDNSFFGGGAGSFNTTGNENTFIGSVAGQLHTTGRGNTYIGKNAGANADPAANGNTALGIYTSLGAGVNNSTAIGARAMATQSNSLVLGGITGVNGGTNTNVGIGTTAPKTKLHLAGGKIYVEANGQGIIMKSPVGACFELTVTDVGGLATAAVACP